MQAGVFLRLGIMMFLQFFTWGAWWVTVNIYMGTEAVAMRDLIFIAYLTQPIGAMISPYFLGMIADRYFSTERVLGAMHLIGGVLLMIAPYFAEGPARSSGAFLGLILLHMLCYMPTIGLTNTLAFHNMSDQEKHFPFIRVFGTVGWIVAGIAVSFMLSPMVGATAEETAWPLYMGAIASLVMGLYSLTLPHTPPPAAGEKPTFRQLAGIDALRQLSSRSFWVFLIASILVCIPLSQYYSYASLFVSDAGIANPAFKMSFGQMTEVLFMVVMPLGFAYLGVKWMLFGGMLAWVARYALFALGAPDVVVWMIMGGILLHGLSYDFFFVTGQIYVDKKAPQRIRGQAQGLLVQATLGLGMFIGMLLSGQVLFNNIVGGTEGQAQLNAYQTFWMIPAVVAGVVMIAFALLFRDEPGKNEQVSEEQTAEAAAKEELP